MNASAYLVFRDESRWNEVFRLTSDRVTAIGRAPSNTIVLKDDRCSRAQAQIRFDEEQDAWFLKDLQSRNGTLVNGRKIDSEADSWTTVLSEFSTAASEGYPLSRK